MSILMLMSCSQDKSLTPDLAQDGDQATLAKAAISTNPVLTIASLATVGSSKLVRNNNGITMSLKTSGLTPGHPHTVWLVIFNVPSSCGTSPCGLADLGVAAVKADVLYAAGHVVGGNGTGTPQAPTG